MSREVRLVLLVMLTLPISYLWKLHPHAWLPFDKVPVYKLFYYSDVKISWPTYISMICQNSIKLIWIYVAWEVFANFRWSLNAFFIIQGMQFIEFFFTFNEAPIIWNVGGNDVEIGLHLAKLIVPWLVFIFELIWKDR